MKVPVSMHIGRASGSHIADEIILTIEDEAAGVQFFRAFIPMDKMMRMLTGGQQAFEAELMSTDKIGKKRHVERLSVVSPDLGHDKNDYKLWLLDNCSEDGWELNTYLGSQSSIVHNKDGTKTLNYTRSKWVDA